MPNAWTNFSPACRPRIATFSSSATQTWNVPQIYQVLRRHNAAFCIYELAGFQSPLEITADFTYVRLHGPGNKYQGDYPQETLRSWAARIEAWRKHLKHIFVYFDNDQAGFAAKNALELKQMVLGR